MAVSGFLRSVQTAVAGETCCLRCHFIPMDSCSCLQWSQINAITGCSSPRGGRRLKLSMKFNSCNHCQCRQMVQYRNAHVRFCILYSIVFECRYSPDLLILHPVTVVTHICEVRNCDKNNNGGTIFARLWEKLCWRWGGTFSLTFLGKKAKKNTCIPVLMLLCF